MLDNVDALAQAGRVIVCGRDLSEPVLERIKAAALELSPRKLAAQLCQWLEWKGPGGRFQVSVAVGVLRQLRQLGVISLAKSQPPLPLFRRRKQPPNLASKRPTQTGASPGASGLERRSGVAAVATAEPPLEGSPAKASSIEPPAAGALPAPPEPIQGSLEQMGPVELVVVGSRFSRPYRFWRQCLDQHHYLGSGPLAGHQLRYLVRDAHGHWLGALAFSAAALRLRARDDWIGWSEEARRENLPYVINNSRCLILPHVQVSGLASEVMEKALGQVGQDWLEKFGYRPLLAETFVEMDRYEGVSYRAAHWRLIGATQGRGRQDRDRSAQLSKKLVLVYPLEAGFREKLCAEPVQRRLTPKPRPEVPPPVPPADWAEEEWGGNDLGDKRLNRRLVTLGRDLGAHPTMPIPQACGSVAKTKAAYRLFDHVRVTMSSVLQSHYRATARRARSEKIILAVQDTTELNYSAHPQTEMLGPICDKKGTIGMLVHDTMAYNGQGMPLGLIDVQCWTRDPDVSNKAKQRYELEIEQKESYKWLVSWRAAVRLQEQCPESTVISMGDREADIYEFLAESKKERRAKVLVRASQERKIQSAESDADPEQEQLLGVWDWMAGRAADGTLRVELPRTAKRKARTAKLEVRYAEVELKAPKRKPHLGPVQVWAVTAMEVGAPAGEEPVEWKLLTTYEVKSFGDAVQVIEWYTERFQIEVFHRTLKSGCRIEDRQLGNAERIEGCLAVDMVAAWRLVHLTKLGREVPEVPCTVFFEEAQWKALVVFATENPQVPATPPTLKEAILLLAKSLGGFLGRGEPGAEIIWRALERLDDLTRMWVLLREGRAWRSSTERELDSS